MALYPVAGSRIYIGDVLEDKDTDFVLGDFAGQSWLEIDGWETAGDIGDEASVITTSIINRGRDIKMKGTRNAGQMQNNFAVIPGEDGQAALIAAEKTENNWAFRIVWEGGQTSYFIAMVVSARFVGGGANTIRMLSSTFEVNSNVVTV